MACQHEQLFEFFLRYRLKELFTIITRKVLLQLMEQFGINLILERFRLFLLILLLESLYQHRYRLLVSILLSNHLQEFLRYLILSLGSS